jgi:predicted metal-dependent phosphoesterase TrpH
VRYDLHVHSTASDGAYAPAAVVRMAAEAGLTGMALTDHDTVAGVAEAVAEGRRLGVEVVPGIELSLQAGDEDIHLLGYWIEYEDPALLAVLDELFAMRVERARGMAARLGDHGRDLDLDAILDEAGGGAPGRPHVARAMVRRGLVGSMEEAFADWIGNDGPAFVPKSLMDPRRGFQLLRRFGAVPVYAHPGLTAWRNHLTGFTVMGLQGLEVDHPKQGLAVRAELREVCRTQGLVATGGSDYHESVSAARALGAEGVSGATVAELRARRVTGAP